MRNRVVIQIRVCIVQFYETLSFADPGNPLVLHLQIHSFTPSPPVPSSSSESRCWNHAHAGTHSVVPVLQTPALPPQLFSTKLALPPPRAPACRHYSTCHFSSPTRFSCGLQFEGKLGRTATVLSFLISLLPAAYAVGYESHALPSCT